MGRAAQHSVPASAAARQGHKSQPWQDFSPGLQYHVEYMHGHGAYAAALPAPFLQKGAFA